MAFIDRMDPDNEDRTISFHALTAGIYLVQTGIFTLGQFKSGFNLDTSDDAQLNQLVAHFQGLSADDQLAFPHKLESLGILWESGVVTKSQFLSNLGIT